MKTFTSLLLVALLLFSCEKIRDYIPVPNFPQFNKAYGGTNDDMGYSIVASLDGGYVMAGWAISNDGDVTTKHERSGAWVVKIDKEGKIIWQTSMGGTNELARSVDLTLDGGYIISGWDTKNEDTNIGWVAKLNNQGDIIWKTYIDGGGFDFANDVAASLDGGFIMVGTTSKNGGDAWVVKLDKEGNIAWQKTIGNSDEQEIANALVADLDGGYTIAGITQPNDRSIWVIKVDKDGNKVWQKSFSAQCGSVESINKALGGGYVIAGYTCGNNNEFNTWVVKLDKQGNVLWEKTYGGSGDEIAFSIITVFDGYITAGYTSSNDGDVSGNQGSIDAWLVKLDKNGNKVWQKTVGGSGDDRALSITTNSNGSYVAAGATTSNDGDVSGYHAGYDFWAFTLKEP